MVGSENATLLLSDVVGDGYLRKKPTWASIGDAMLMRPNKTERAIYACLMPARLILVLRMRTVKTTPRGILVILKDLI